jgi:hypothetical protein
LPAFISAKGHKSNRDIQIIFFAKQTGLKMNDKSKRVSATRADDEDVMMDMENESTSSADSSAEEHVLAKDETKMVYRFRIILIVLLLLTAILVSMTAYFMAADGEYIGFEKNFESQAAKVRYRIADASCLG